MSALAEHVVDLFFHLRSSRCVAAWLATCSGDDNNNGLLGCGSRGCRGKKTTSTLCFVRAELRARADADSVSLRHPQRAVVVLSSLFSGPSGVDRKKTAAQGN